VGRRKHGVYVRYVEAFIEQVDREDDVDVPVAQCDEGVAAVPRRCLA
jgi:hypothetical protein